MSGSTEQVAERRLERRAGDDALRDLIDGEYHRNVMVLAYLRTGATIAWLVLAIILPALSPEEFEWIAVQRLWVGIHAAYAVILLAGLKAGLPAFKTFHRATQACPDVAFLGFTLYATLGAVIVPQAVASLAPAFFLAAYVPGPAGTRRAPLHGAAALSVFLQAGLFWAAGMQSWVWIAATAVVFGYSAALAVYIAGRFRLIAVTYAKGKAAE